MYDHPGDPEHVMRIYRKHILHAKRKYGTARCLVKYQGFIDTYLSAKRLILSQRKGKVSE